MALITPWLRIRSIPDGAVRYDDNLDLLGWAIEWVLDQVGTMSYEVGYGSAAAAALMDARRDPPARLVAELSLNGGSTYWYRKIVSHVQQSIAASGPTITDDGSSMTNVYATVGVDHKSLVNVTLQDALFGAAGAIRMHPDIDGDTGIMALNALLPRVKGLFQVKPGLGSDKLSTLMQNVPVCDPAVADLIVSIDSWADYVLQAATTLVSRLGGQWLEGDTAPPSARGHWVEDSGDAAVNITGVSQGIAVGAYSTVPAVTFFGGQLAHGVVLDYHDTARIAEGAAVEATIDEIYGQVEATGGLSNHGLADGHKVTGIVMVNPNGPKVAWDTNLIVFSTYIDQFHGGVWFTPQDGQAHAISAQIGVKSLAFWSHTNKLYAGTDTGVVERPSNDYSPATRWQPTGGLIHPVDRIQVIGDSAQIAYIFAHVAGGDSTGGGLYRYPAIGGHVDLGLGYDFWTRIHAHPNIVTFCASDPLTVFVVYKEQPNIVVRMNFTEDPLVDPTITPCPTPNGSAVTALSYVPEVNYIFVSTATGAPPLFVLAPGNTTMDGADKANSLRTFNGIPVQVNRVSGYKGSINGRVVALFAATDHGPFFSNNPQGVRWFRCTGQSGMDEVSLDFVVAGQPQTALGSDKVVVAAATPEAIYISNSGTIWWYNLMRASLDLAPFFVALAQEIGELPFPDNDVTALGNVAGFGAPGGSASSGQIVGIIGKANPTTGHLILDDLPDSSTGGTGRSVAIPAGSKRALPAGWFWARRLDERNDFAYRLVNLGSHSPSFAIMLGQVTELQANTDVPPTVAAEQLALVHFRWLAENSVLQTTLTLPSQAQHDDDPLLRLRPTHGANVNYVGAIARKDRSGAIVSTAYVDYDNEFFSVLRHGISQQGSGPVLTSTQVGKILLVKRSTLADLANDMAFGVKQIRKFGVRNTR